MTDKPGTGELSPATFIEIRFADGKTLRAENGAAAGIWRWLMGCETMALVHGSRYEGPALEVISDRLNEAINITAKDAKKYLDSLEALSALTARLESASPTCIGYPMCDGNLPGEVHAPECPCVHIPLPTDPSERGASPPDDHDMCLTCGMVHKIGECAYEPD